MRDIRELHATVVAAGFAAAVVLGGSVARAEVTLSKDATQDMSCSGGVCAPTNDRAVLNAGDLETMLAAGNVTVVTINSGVQARNIRVATALSWTAATSLTLDAFRSITVTGAVTDEGAGGVSIITNDGGSGGSLSFLRKGSITFPNPKDSLSINGTSYKLVTDIRSLARAAVANPGGAFALADNYDAKRHHLFRTVPLPVVFTGAFNGLGHSISGPEIGDSADEYVGFIWSLESPGTISGFGLKNVVIESPDAQGTGGLVGYMQGGTVSNSWVSGSVQGGGSAGGIVGTNSFSGTIVNSWSSAQVTRWSAGGLVGDNQGTIELSFATGDTTGYNTQTGGENAQAGGLVGYSSAGAILNSYATGTAQGPGSGAEVGGLIGNSYETGIDGSYATGMAEAGGANAVAGGFAGTTDVSNINNCYWDTTTSGTLTGVGQGSNTGVTGLTTTQLQSGLPAGFDPHVWAENPDVNEGLPYLIANPPPR